MPTFKIIDAQNLTDLSSAFKGIANDVHGNDSGPDWDQPDTTAAAGDEISATGAPTVAITINPDELRGRYRQG